MTIGLPMSHTGSQPPSPQNQDSACQNSTPSDDKKWGDAEKQAWYQEQTIQRSYADEVLQKIHAADELFDIHQYGQLTYDEYNYPVFCVKTKNQDESKKNILITGGVHGYETSGVQGALRFMETQAQHYAPWFNIVIIPCVSPWGYESINRWNPNAIDPNRSFRKDSLAQESALVLKIMDDLNASPQSFLAHFDLHETTDTDNSIFRPALEARDGIKQDQWDIPDGFYLVGDSENPNHAFQQAIITSVKTVTHIAPSDQNNCIIGEKISQEGVINYPIKHLGLCTGYTQCQYSTTTEVYPDSALVDSEQCIKAQVASICGGLDFLIDQHNISQ